VRWSLDRTRLLIDLDGQPEVVVFTYGEVSGLNPRSGALDWTVPHASDQGVNVATPVWGSDHLLFVSSAYNGGSRVLRLSRQDGKVNVEEVWANRRVRIHFGNAVRDGKRVYASNGDFGAAPFAAFVISTGDMLWRDRSVARSTLIGVGGRQGMLLVLLDEDGNLVLATPGDTGLVVHAKAGVLSPRAWTAPTLSGNTLPARPQADRRALDLSGWPDARPRSPVAGRERRTPAFAVRSSNRIKLDSRMGDSVVRATGLAGTVLYGAAIV
jgi:hypothetical protein